MKCCALTDVGRKRQMNQDTVFSTDKPIGPLYNLYIVADGMGGENAGDYASRETVNSVVDFIMNTEIKKPVEAFEQAISVANKKIFDESTTDDNKKGMGTTLVIATAYDGHLYVANVGDSRLYVVTAGKLTQITKDHSVVAELVRKGKLDRDLAKNHPNKNMITRAVGVESVVTADYFDVTIRGEETVLLCSDGLTNMVSDKDILNTVLNGKNVDDVAVSLVEMANDAGGKDNISVIVLKV